MPTALITGATAGIGAEFGAQLASFHYRLVLVARDEQRLAQRRVELLASGAPDVQVLSADLSTPAGRAAVAARLSATQEPVDLLVNNAGFGLGKDFLDCSPQELQEQIDVNVSAVVALARAVLPGMVDRGHGAVINVASIAGLIPGRGTTYAGSKAFVISFSEGLGISLRGTGVRVQALCPGFVRTEFHQRAGIDMASMPSRAYVDPARLVRDSLADLRANRLLSIPSALYKTIAVGARLLPRGLVRSAAARINNSGRT